MVDYRTALAAVLGVGLGVVLLAFPSTVVRAHLVGRVPHDRGGPYGTAEEVPERWRRLVRLVGVGLVLLGAAFGASLLGWGPLG